MFASGDKIEPSGVLPNPIARATPLPARLMNTLAHFNRTYRG